MIQEVLATFLFPHSILLFPPISLCAIKQSQKVLSISQTCTMSFLSVLASQNTVSRQALDLAARRNKPGMSVMYVPPIGNRELLGPAPDSKPHAALQPIMLASASISSSSSEGVGSTVYSLQKGQHSRQRIDETAVSADHAKRLAKSRKYQENARNASELALNLNDDQLQCLLMSSQGTKLFPKTSAIFQQSAAQAAAANAVKTMVATLPPKSAHKQAIVGKLRGAMTGKEFNAFFDSISARYARKAAQATRAAQQTVQEGGKLKKPDIFSQQVMVGAEREKITPFESRITASVVKENLGAKSGSNAAFWFGSLDSFHKWFRTTAHVELFAQMVEESGGLDHLLVKMNGGKWVTENGKAYECKGQCVAPGSNDVCHHNYVPRSRPTVTKILKDEDVIFRCITKTVPCKWHDNWDRWKAELVREEAKTAEQRVDEKIKRLKEKIRKCIKHDVQYKVQRRSCGDFRISRM